LLRTQPTGRPRSNLAPLRVLVEPSDYVIRNLGDTAMLTVALERISALWPEARIQVFTEEPEQMPRPRSNIEPLPLTGRRLWFERTWVPHRLQKFGDSLERAQRTLRRAHPMLAYRALSRWGGFTPEEIDHLTDFFEAVSAADLLIVTGMGGITTAFPRYAFELLEVVRCAQRFGAKTVMLGQGLGPIETVQLREAASGALRRLDLLTLREQRAGLPLLKRLGVSLERVIVTGDDAIELACRYAGSTAGAAIGINLRNAAYAGIQSADVENVRVALLKLSEKLGVPLVGVPISRVPGEEDAHTIAELGNNGPDEVADLSHIRTPKDAIIQLRRCRILVAGSYHAAVFALSSGIPTVALASSTYYVDKFLGLADMFGAGCKVVRLGEPDFAERFSEAALEVWDSADRLRAPLLAAAQRQLRQSREAYSRLRELVH
jgi:polysaccharide pyruvyl transferase WcaK-like protein